MDTTRVQIQDASNVIILGSKALLWGNNAAWICTECMQLCGNRTGDSEHVVECCKQKYEIMRAPNKSGNLHMGAATGVRIL